MDEKTLNAFLAEYADQLPTLNALTPRLERLLHDLLCQYPFAIHSIKARTKDRSRLARKLEEHDPSYESLADDHDLVGARIITYFP
ncbi:MAG TPA: (p)ppGpp synthetase, partial [Actinomycetota bacterium]|nr:(p)ppGpp synthetase [Actinomycetota bacterium]